MKTYNDLWDKFISKENFEIACENSQKHGKKKQAQIVAFNKNREENLKKVRQLVIDGKFHTSEYRERTIYEPKERTIYILPYAPDRIVQHAVMNILSPILLSKMIDNTYSCIVGRGQIKASLKCSEYVRKYDYCLKCDIRKFYPSINQIKLSEMLHRIIKDDKFMAVVDDIIFSFKDKEKPLKNIPIGNYTSQWLGNYYLTRLDNFVYHELKCHGYERFCDDFMLFSNDKTYLHYCRNKISEFINTQLDLEFSKADVFHTKQGVDFCGYRHFKNYVLVRKNTAKRLKRRVRRIKKKLDNDDCDIELVQGQLASGNGVMSHACTHHLRVALDYDKLTKLAMERSKLCQ